MPFHIEDHPRIRGEHHPPPGTRSRAPGSSPHTRGAPSTNTAHTAAPRIIPAYAGSTLPCELSRGDGDGSSPHTRGALVAGVTADGDPGIIPAYAGSTGAFVDLHLSIPDHPRIRGEHGVDRDSQLLFAGSSPHTRGARRPGHAPPELAGIIPAYAGSTTKSRIEIFSE